MGLLSVLSVLSVCDVGVFVAKRLDRLRMKVGLGPGHIVLDGDPPQKGHIPSNFWPMSVVAKGLDGSRRHLVRR